MKDLWISVIFKNPHNLCLPGNIVHKDTDSWVQRKLSREELWCVDNDKDTPDDTHSFRLLHNLYMMYVHSSIPITEIKFLVVSSWTNCGKSGFLTIVTVWLIIIITLTTFNPAKSDRLGNTNANSLFHKVAKESDY